MFIADFLLRWNAMIFSLWNTKKKSEKTSNILGKITKTLAILNIYKTPRHTGCRPMQLQKFHKYKPLTRKFNLIYSAKTRRLRFLYLENSTQWKSHHFHLATN